MTTSLLSKFKVPNSGICQQALDLMSKEDNLPSSGPYSPHAENGGSPSLNGSEEKRGRGLVVVLLILLENGQYH